ncbi:MAG: glycerate kinase [Clostridia bacterium]|nr:glycerate kinase [Clostridia bacterium]
MEIFKFALGARFDLLKNEVTDDDVRMLLSELASALSTRDVEDLHIYSGVCRLDARDSGGVCTFVFMNGNLGKMRRLYKLIDCDAKLHALLDTREPFIQNNIIRDFEGMEYIGVVQKDGSLTGGSGRDIRFPLKAEARTKYSPSNTIILAPNSFKGTIPAFEAVRRLSAAIRKRLPMTSVVAIPAADGGDGTLEAFESCILTRRRTASVTGPYGQKINADYLIADGVKAIIESAKASGLALCGGMELDPKTASSCGTGELILRAAHEGAREIFVCLGGSATNDSGIGMARALGCRFYDDEMNEITDAADMARIKTISAEGIDPLVRGAKFTVVCDVTNPLTGNNGATYIFGPQKGASAEDLELLEHGMQNMGKLLDAFSGRSVCLENGAGAAGGMGAMLMAVFSAIYMSGAEAVLSISEFDRKLRNCSIVVTGEGMIDATSLDGKLVGAVIEHAEKQNVPVAIIAGCKGEGAGSVEKRAVFTVYAENGNDHYARFDDAAERLTELIANYL